MDIEIKQIIEKAEAGDMKSQSFLASMYYQGTGRAKAKKIGISREKDSQLVNIYILIDNSINYTM